MTRQLRALYAHLSSGSRPRAASALALLAACARRGRGLAWETLRSFDFSLAALPRLAAPRRPDTSAAAGAGDTPRQQHQTSTSSDVLKRPLRELHASFALSLLAPADGALRRAALAHKALLGAALRGLSGDAPRHVSATLRAVRHTVLAPDSGVPPRLRAALFSDAALDALAALSAKHADVAGGAHPEGSADADSAQAASEAYTVLFALLTDPAHGMLPGINDAGAAAAGGAAARALRVLRRLRSAHCAPHATLLLAAAQTRPALAAALLDRLPFSLEPRPSAPWFAASALTSRLLLIATSAPPHAVPASGSATHHPEAVAAAAVRRVVPPALARGALGRGLAHPSALVRYSSLLMLIACLDALRAALRACAGDAQRAAALRSAAREALPDPSAVIAIAAAPAHAAAQQPAPPAAPPPERKRKRDVVPDAADDVDEEREGGTSDDEFDEVIPPENDVADGAAAVIPASAGARALLRSRALAALGAMRRLVPSSFSAAAARFDPGRLLPADAAAAAALPSAEAAAVLGALLAFADADVADGTCTGSNAATAPGQLATLLRLLQGARAPAVAAAAGALLSRRMDAAGALAGGLQSDDAAEASAWLRQLPRRADDAEAADAVGAFLAEAMGTTARRGAALAAQMADASAGTMASDEDDDDVAAAEMPGAGPLAVAALTAASKVAGSAKRAAAERHAVCGFVAAALRALLAAQRRPRQLAAALLAAMAASPPPKEAPAAPLHSLHALCQAVCGPQSGGASCDADVISDAAPASLWALLPSAAAAAGDATAAGAAKRASIRRAVAAAAAACAPQLRPAASRAALFWARRGVATAAAADVAPLSAAPAESVAISFAALQALIFGPRAPPDAADAAACGHAAIDDVAAERNCGEDSAHAGSTVDWAAAEAALSHPWLRRRYLAGWAHPLAAAALDDGATSLAARVADALGGGDASGERSSNGGIDAATAVRLRALLRAYGERAATALRRALQAHDDDEKTDDADGVAALRADVAGRAARALLRHAPATSARDAISDALAASGTKSAKAVTWRSLGPALAAAFLRSAPAAQDAAAAARVWRGMLAAAARLPGGAAEAAAFALLADADVASEEDAPSYDTDSGADVSDALTPHALAAAADCAPLLTRTLAAPHAPGAARAAAALARASPAAATTICAAIADATPEDDDVASALILPLLPAVRAALDVASAASAPSAHAIAAARAAQRPLRSYFAGTLSDDDASAADAAALRRHATPTLLAALALSPARGSSRRAVLADAMLPSGPRGWLVGGARYDDASVAASPLHRADLALRCADGAPGAGKRKELRPRFVRCAVATLRTLWARPALSDDDVALEAALLRALRRAAAAWPLRAAVLGADVAALALAAASSRIQAAPALDAVAALVEAVRAHGGDVAAADVAALGSAVLRAALGASGFGTTLADARADVAPLPPALARAPAPLPSLMPLLIAEDGDAAAASSHSDGDAALSENPAACAAARSAKRALARLLAAGLAAAPAWAPAPGSGEPLLLQLLSCYGATMSATDRALLAAITALSARLGGAVPYLWGAAAAAAARGAGGGDAAAVASALRDVAPPDCRRAAATALRFPLRRALPPVDDLGADADAEEAMAGSWADSFYDPSASESGAFGEGPSPLETAAYDPAFILPAAATLLTSRAMTPRDAVARGLLPAALAGLACCDDGMRSAAYAVLGAFMAAIDDVSNTLHGFREQPQVAALLLALRAAVPSPLARLPSLSAALFAAEASAALLHADCALYAPLSRLLLRRADALSDAHPPLLIPMLHSGAADTWRADRVWALRMLRAGLAGTADADVARRAFAAELVMALAGGSLADGFARCEAMRAIRAAMRLEEYAVHLVDHSGVVTWLAVVGAGAARDAQSGTAGPHDAAAAGLAASALRDALCHAGVALRAHDAARGAFCAAAAALARAATDAPAARRNLLPPLLALWAALLGPAPVVAGPRAEAAAAARAAESPLLPPPALLALIEAAEAEARVAPAATAAALRCAALRVLVRAAPGAAAPPRPLSSGADAVALVALLGWAARAARAADAAARRADAAVGALPRQPWAAQVLTWLSASVLSGTTNFSSRFRESANFFIFRLSDAPSAGGDALLASLASLPDGGGCGAVARHALALHASLPPRPAASAAWPLATALLALLPPLRDASVPILAHADDDVAEPPSPAAGSASFAASAPVYRIYLLGEPLLRLMARLPDPRAVPAAAWRADDVACDGDADAEAAAPADVAHAALRDAALAMALAVLGPLWRGAPPHAFVTLLRAWSGGDDAAPGGAQVAALVREELEAAQAAAGEADAEDGAWRCNDGNVGWTLRGLLGLTTGAPSAKGVKQAAKRAAPALDEPARLARRPRLQL